MFNKTLGKKAIIIETLMRMVLMIGLLVISFYALSQVYKAISPQKDESYLKNMVGIMNNDLGDGSIRPFLLSLSENNAIIGYSKDATSFKCPGCLSTLAKTMGNSNQRVLESKKPQTPECQSTSCVCLCTDASPSEKPTSSSESYVITYALNCRKMQCKSLVNNIPQQLVLFESYNVTNYLNINVQNWPFWQNGFFFVNSQKMNNGILNMDIKKELSLQGKKMDGTLYVAACTAETKGCMYELPPMP